MRYKKDLNVSRIRMGELSDDMSLTDKVGLICDILPEIVRAVSEDLNGIDADNFSENGVEQIKEIAREVMSE